MKEFKKTISLILALMISLSMLNICVSANAAADEPTGTITVTSNVAQPFTIDYFENSCQVTVTYELQSSYSVLNTQSYVEYDSNVLELDTVDLETNLPKLSTGSVLVNTEENGKVYISASRLNFYNFKTASVYYTQTFNIVGNGDTTVNLNIEVLTGTDQTSFETASGHNDILLVNYDYIDDTGFTLVSSATLGGQPSLDNGYYLIGEDWFLSSIDSANKFTLNPANQNEYKLSTNLSPGEKIKVVRVENNQITAWYPDGFGNEYTVDNDHFGDKTIYFQTSYNSNWSYFGGFIYIESNTQMATEESTEPSTIEPTEEPTTEEPTEEPTTVAPTTEEPTTVEPTVAPDPTNTTIKLVVPNNINSAYAWNDARLYYNFTGKTADNQYINMTQTNDTYYMTQLGTGITEIAAAGAWKVFTVTVTPEQAAQIDGAIWVGFANGNNRNKTVSQKSLNVLKAGVGEFDASYSNNKASIADFDGYTFIVKDNNSATSPYTSFIGYWTSDFTTVMMAAPMSDNSYSNWNAVSLSYGESGDSETAIPMFNTGTTTKVADIGDMSTLRTGRWYIYALTLDAAQTAEVNAAKRVGFVKPGGNNRTAGSKNVLKAKTNSFDGNYNATARTLEELEGQLFVVKAKASASSIVIYNGEWQTEDVYTAGNNDTVTIYFAAPKGADNTTAGWNTGVELYYGGTTAYQNCARMEMTPVNGFRNVSIDGTGLTTLKSGDWDLYAIELNAEEISTIDAATTVGFIKKGSYNRTSALYTKNIAKAPTTENGEYTNNKQSIETFDGRTFVINTCADSKNERTSYMGIWS